MTVASLMANRSASCLVREAGRRVPQHLALAGAETLPACDVLAIWRLGRALAPGRRHHVPWCPEQALLDVCDSVHHVFRPGVSVQDAARTCDERVGRQRSIHRNGEHDDLEAGCTQSPAQRQHVVLRPSSSTTLGGAPDD